MLTYTPPRHHFQSQLPEQRLTYVRAQRFYEIYILVVLANPTCTAMQSPKTGVGSINIDWPAYRRFKAMTRDIKNNDWPANRRFQAMTHDIKNIDWTASRRF